MNVEEVSYPEGTAIISCDINKTAENVMLKILGTESLPDAIESNLNVKGYPWIIETKYYTAKINLYVLREKVELDSAFCDAIKAIVFYFDNQKPSSFEDIISWMPVLKDIEAEVKILVCNNYSEESESTALEKKNVLDWCIKNEYELVELNSLNESDDEDERAFKDVKGYERVIQALQSHTWCNMNMKGEKQNETLLKESSLNEQKGLGTEDTASNSKAACGGASEDQNLKKVKEEAVQLEEQWLNDLASGDPNGESFEALFTKFASMKEKAAGLTGNERKKFAEMAAIEFWRAMGGDEDEIAGLDDDDED